MFFNNNNRLIKIKRFILRIIQIIKLIIIESYLKLVENADL